MCSVDSHSEPCSARLTRCHCSKARSFGAKSFRAKRCSTLGQLNGGVALGFGAAMMQDLAMHIVGKVEAMSQGEYKLPTVCDTPTLRGVSLRTPVSAKAAGEVTRSGVAPATALAALSCLLIAVLGAGCGGAATAPTVAPTVSAAATTVAPTVSAAATTVAPTVSAAATTVAPTVSAAATAVAPTVSAAATTVAPTVSAAATTVATVASGAAAGTGTGADAACSLATAADVSTAYGEQFDSGKPSSPGGVSACLFTQSGGGVDSAQLTVATGAQADVFYSANRSAYDSTDVAGLGDKAFVSNDGGMIGVQRSSTTFLMHLVGFEKDTPASLQAKQKAFAQTVLSKM